MSPSPRVRALLAEMTFADRSGDEVILVFLEDVVASVAPPVRRLVEFDRRTLDAGETATVSFDLGARELGFWATDAADARFVVEPGLFRLHIGPTLDRTQAVELRVSDRPTTITAHEGDPR